MNMTWTWSYVVAHWHRRRLRKKTTYDIEFLTLRLRRPLNSLLCKRASDRKRHDYVTRHTSHVSIEGGEGGEGGEGVCVRACVCSSEATRQNCHFSRSPGILAFWSCLLKIDDRSKGREYPTVTDATLCLAVCISDVMVSVSDVMISISDVIIKSTSCGNFCFVFRFCLFVN